MSQNMHQYDYSGTSTNMSYGGTENSYSSSSISYSPQQYGSSSGAGSDVNASGYGNMDYNVSNDYSSAGDGGLSNNQSSSSSPYNSMPNSSGSYASMDTTMDSRAYSPVSGGSIVEMSGTAGAGGVQVSGSDSPSNGANPDPSDPSKTKKPKVKGQGGSSCHQCKSRRNFTALTYCTSNLDKKNKKCRKKFCGHCLKKFYKETPQAIADKTSWRCPSCRKLCCCAACRRRKTKEAGGPASESGAPSAGTPKAGSSKPPSKKQKKSHSSTPQQEYPSDSDSDDSLPYSGVSSPSSHPQNVPESPYSQPHPVRDIAIPPVPTVMMSTSDLSSPMNTPLQAPSQFGFHGDELLLKGEYSDDGNDLVEGSRRSGHPSNSHYSDDEGGLPYSPPAGPIDSSSAAQARYNRHYLTTTVRQHAKQAVRSGYTTPFARMYNLWQNNLELNKKVQSTLIRQDLTPTQRVEVIAEILRSSDHSEDSQSYAPPTPIQSQYLPAASATASPVSSTANTNTAYSQSTPTKTEYSQVPSQSQSYQDSYQQQPVQSSYQALTASATSYTSSSATSMPQAASTDYTPQPYQWTPEQYQQYYAATSTSVASATTPADTSNSGESSQTTGTTTTVPRATQQNPPAAPPSTGAT